MAGKSILKLLTEGRRRSRFNRRLEHNFMLGLDALALERRCEYRPAVEFISELLTEGTQGTQ